MRQLRPHSLWLGHAGDGRDFRRILDADIMAVVQLAAEEPALALPRDLIYYRFPLLDGADNDPKVLCLAILAVAELLERSIPTLACCSAGMSRAPAVAAAGIAAVTRIGPDESLNGIAQHHPADVAPALWRDIKNVLQHSRFQFQP